MTSIHNPIIPGFNPDPSIVRVGDDFFLANSTFEWYPGVQIHHSRDLVHWRLLTQPLTRKSQLDMIGNPASNGVWAPCLSHCNGMFHLIYTDMKNADHYKDGHNYLVTAPDIMGPWSDPIFLNSSGFDPSLFHDDDGRKWLVNLVWDHRKGKNSFGGIILQEYDPVAKELTGPIETIFTGSFRGCTEGPHLYKRDGWYYLMTAEGGTGYDHAVTICRSRSIHGPYDLDPLGSMMTATDDRNLPLQKAGHASLTDTPNGEWYMPHLCARPRGPEGRCMLGRETAIQKVEWSDDGWLRLTGGGTSPELTVPAPKLPACPFPALPSKDDFDKKKLSVQFSTLREPAEESWASLRERPGFLRLYGRESLASFHRQSMVARRLQAFEVEAETAIEFDPQSYQQMAGLTLFYNHKFHIYCHVSRDEELGKCLRLIEMDKGKYDELMEPVSVEGWDRVYLRLRLEDGPLQFFYSADGGRWKAAGPELDGSKISDEYVCRTTYAFTGAFIGICCQDLSGRRLPADFDYFRYEELT